MKFLFRLGASMITLGILCCLGGVIPLALLLLSLVFLPLAIAFGGVLLVLFLFACAVCCIFL
ncbi:MAG: hypothetical protein HFH28_03800 [Clostridiaceae bacterium]|nr:hypothetical protein [Clostridiaceae bacterium]